MIILINPKYPANLGAAVRLASAWDMRSVIWTGNRVTFEDGERTPRELRMREYAHIHAAKVDRPFDQIPQGHIPVAIEVLDHSENLMDFVHPLQAAYVFGPEDGSIPAHLLRLCHRFVSIPTPHCINLATAIATVAYDRKVKLR